MNKSGYRVFISYSRTDIKIVELVAEVLEGLKYKLDYDRSIHPGTPFSDSIRAMIGRAHVFIPILTSGSSDRAWVHQEIGYAMALGVPVLPIGFGVDPSGMLQGFHVVKVPYEDVDTTRDEIAQQLERELSVDILDQIVRPKPQVPLRPIEVADWPEIRTEKLARYTEQILKFDSDEPIRQIGGHSSFCIPRDNYWNIVWKARDGIHVRSDYYHELQRQERRSFEDYARKRGCKLIIFPKLNVDKNYGEGTTLVRLHTLWQFLKGADDHEKPIEVVASSRVLGMNIAIIGDWFVAESRSPRKGGYLHTVFNWHGPTVLQAISDFDEMFKKLYEKTIGDQQRTSREIMIEKLEEIIREESSNLGIQDTEAYLNDSKKNGDFLKAVYKKMSERRNNT